MIRKLVVVSLWIALSATALPAASQAVMSALQMEEAGQINAARVQLARAARNAPSDAETLLTYAAFLDRYGDSGSVEAYRRALEALPPGSQEQRRLAARRLLAAALIDGDQQTAKWAAGQYRAAGGPDVSLSEPPAARVGSDAYGSTTIPGLLLGFQRMAALSTDQAPHEWMPALARNIFTGGYRSTRGAESLEQTEYLKLLLQYLTLARELTQFAGPDQIIDVPACESAETAQLLKILGFRLRNECGPEAVLETVNPSRAFLSIDSAFPLADLEAAFQKDEPYHLPYAASRIPVLFGQEYWMGGASKKVEGDFIDVFLNDPALSRLYVAMAKLHRPTALALKEKIPVERLKNYAHVLDFFGASFEIEGGRAVTPGGDRTRRVWEKMVGASPNNGAEFFQRLIETDDGWMAAFYDSVARASGPALAYFTEPSRMERFYMAVRGRVTSPGPARPIFRANADLMLLTTRADFRDGRPHIPGGVGPWQHLFTEHPHGKYDGKLTKSASGWKDADDVLEAMFALCRKVVENEPLRIFLTVTHIDRQRPTPLSPEIVQRLILDYPKFGSQYALFNETPGMPEKAVSEFLDMAAAIDNIGNTARRSNAAGVAQALLGLWQVFVRQGQIPPERAGETFEGLVASCRTMRNEESIFDAARAGVRWLLTATGAPEEADPQQRLLGLLAGNPAEADRAAHNEIAERLTLLFNRQRLVSIKDILDLADHLERVSRGEPFNVAMANRLAASISEVRLPSANLSTPEANAFSQGHWVEKHISEQRSLNLRREVDRAGGNPENLLELRGQLAPLLRDSLVGLLYIYYAPPGAELIRTNPLFVRSHDFLGYGGGSTWSSTQMHGAGWPNSAGGRLTGSLIDLPYAIADAEQNFLIPTERQALIWQDLAPQILMGATVPRWWGLTPAEMHFVGLHLRLGRSLVAQAGIDPEVGAAVHDFLRQRVMPARLWHVREAAKAGQTGEALRNLAPAELYHLAAHVVADEPQLSDRAGAPFAARIRDLMAGDGERFRYSRMARIFGMPHPQLARTYRPDLLHLPLFPTLMGYSSRVLAESWESTNLYWAALADELHLAPARLNLMVPEWTQKSLERIFATHLEDWPALLRSMRIVGERYREQLRPREPAPVQAAAPVDAAAVQ